MFAAFQADAEREGWVCYPETCGHDLLLEAGPGLDLGRWRGVERGDIVAIEGKLTPNLRVLEQAVPPWYTWLPREAADWYAVVVPHVPSAFLLAATGLGVLVFQRPPDATWGPQLVHGPCIDHHRRGTWPEEYRVVGFEALRPPLRVAGVAGQPAPAVVTRWKVEACKLALSALAHPDLEVTSLQFRAANLDARLWLMRGWIVRVRRDGRTVVYRLVHPWPTGQPHPPPHVRYPEVVQALGKDA